MTNEFFDPSLNIETKKFAENSEGGILVCGSSWGGEPEEASEAPDRKKPPTFFSDTENTYRYKERLVKCFELLGHPLKRTKGEEGPFERSFAQTNWLPIQSRDSSEIKVPEDLINGWGNLERTLITVKPGLIVLSGVELLEVLNSPELKDRVLAVLGPSESGGPTILQREISDGSKTLRAFKIGTQRFKNADVIALPHPTGSWGLSYAYIAAFKDILSPIIAAYKAKRGFPP